MTRHSPATLLLMLVALISLLSNPVLCYNYTSFEECVAAKGNQSFPSDDGCNTCGCDGGGQIVCTMRACLDPPEPWYTNHSTLSSTEVALIVIIVVITVSIATVALIMQYIKKRQQQQSSPQHSYYVKTSS
ncbi:hypothetical protein MP638_004311 [Amoeboaphelidium occidentale]|nr:hypothetical protein MP638_004311 [Amoeboaphelidium occidentale]